MPENKIVVLVVTDDNHIVISIQFYPKILEEPESYWLLSADHPMRSSLLALKEVIVNDWRRHPETSGVSGYQWSVIKRQSINTFNS